jgi:molybdenum cofactor cytidylyltransferase
MLSSLQCGLRRLSVEASGVMFCPVDLPAVRPETAGLVVERFLKARPPVALPEFHGRHGHPVCISAEVAGEILALPPEAQASDVIHRHMTGALIVPVDDPGVVSDVDDRNDYRRLTEEAV